MGIWMASDADSHMTALALELCCPMMVDKQHHANVGMSMREHALPLILVKSSLLQGQALQPNNPVSLDALFSQYPFIVFMLSLLIQANASQG
jgi:hypothetical protein